MTERIKVLQEEGEGLELNVSGFIRDFWSYESVSCNFTLVPGAITDGRYLFSAKKVWVREFPDARGNGRGNRPIFESFAVYSILEIFGVFFVFKRWQINNFNFIGPLFIQFSITDGPKQNLLCYMNQM